MNMLLTSETGLSVATGCALFLLGLSIGLFIAGMCLALAATPILGDCKIVENCKQEDSASIGDDDLALVIELVREAVAGSGWTLCGDCYARNLLLQVPLPNPADRGLQMNTVSCGSPLGSVSNTRGCSGGTGSTHRVDEGQYVAHPTPDSGKNRSEQRLRVEQLYPVGRCTSPYCIANERNDAP